MTTFLLTLVRHGTTSTKRRIPKTIDCKENTLSRKGHCQADLLGERLKCEHFTHIYCSDVTKARETATVIANRNRWSSDLTIHEDARLEELRSTNDCQEGLKTRSTSRIDKVETLEDLRHRAEDFFLEICNLMQMGNKGKSDNDSEDGGEGANILVVTHKSLIREMLRYFYAELGCPLPRRSGRRMNWNSSHTGVSVFRVTIERTEELLNNIRVACLVLNDNSHLSRRSGSCGSDDLDLDKSVELPS